MKMNFFTGWKSDNKWDEIRRNNLTGCYFLSLHTTHHVSGVAPSPTTPSIPPCTNPAPHHQQLHWYDNPDCNDRPSFTLVTEIFVYNGIHLSRQRFIIEYKCKTTLLSVTLKVVLQLLWWMCCIMKWYHRVSKLVMKLAWSAINCYWLLLATVVYFS